MRLSWSSVLLIISIVVALHTSPAWADAPPSAILKRHGDDKPQHANDNHDSHRHDGPPLLKLNESRILEIHSPTPPSYWTIDIDRTDPSASTYPGLMALHVLLMSSAFFIALPIRIAMRAVNSSWRPLVDVAFYSLCVLGCVSSAVYSKLTPNMYEGAKHRTHGYLLLFAAVALSALDFLGFIRRLISHARSGDIKGFWDTVILRREKGTAYAGEYVGLAVEEVEPQEFSSSQGHTRTSSDRTHHSRSSFVLQTQPDLIATWINNNTSEESPFSPLDQAQSEPGSSRGSDDTVPYFGREPYQVPRKPISRHKRIGSIAFAVVERSFVFAAFAQVLSGVIVYTGGCRNNYINGCLAHLIKGGIFWCYGLVTFARFLGAFSEYGWAWNRSPNSKAVSAEFVESLVIFLYGITNVWMERFGASAGDPYTTKQLQHISIAAMFWFAGLVGMTIESHRVRRWLASGSILSVKEQGTTVAVCEPRSYSASFNPFPALVIGVTGAAMAAHHQDYVFQVQIHMLWGNLLVAFSILRCLTYFFLWLSPPTSVLPSRPPTEALGSFFLACGGLTFILSSEEVTFAAMRRGRDDMMMFLNVTVAMTCFAMFWVLAVVSFKGWLRHRSLAQASCKRRFA